MTIGNELEGNGAKGMAAYPTMSLPECSEEREIMSKLMQRDAQVIQAFREVAENDPGRIAVVSNGRELSFGEVMGRGAAIAGELRSSGVCPGVTVGAYLPRGLSLVPAVLGTWLAGGGYVPVDPDAPRGRAESMLRDSG
ncbi:MAG: AMP-binding protein, partial [Nocardiopsaceae bacterium]|nr:AMP-binding protein [Nocardiopsaceae bacterium]